MAAKGGRAKRGSGMRTGAAIGAGVVGLGALAIAWWQRNAIGGIFGTPLPKGHPAPDLALDQPHPGPDHRAPEHFRPDGDAPVPPGDREALRPATGTGPTLVKGQADELVRANAAPS